MKIKRYIFKIAPLLTALFVLAILFTPHAAQAQETTIGRFAASAINNLLASLAYAALFLASQWIAITGTLLNVSVTLTMHIKDFVNSTPGVYTVWQTIRDISGMFIIFILLYASFMMILDKDSKQFGSVGNVIKNVIIVGILINFSFFLTSLAIDTSNIVSLALYHAMAPGSDIVLTSACASNNGTNNGKVFQDVANASMGKNPTNGCIQKYNPQYDKGTWSSGGLSDIFMNSLKVQSIFSPNNITLSDTTGTPSPLRIILMAAAGVVIMLTTGISFLLAALAFIARLGILIFLLAFSPIWIAGMIIPKLADKAKQWTSLLVSQLIFMPVYLLLMYAALRVLTSSSFILGSTGSLWAGTNDPTFSPTSLIVLAINYVLVIFMLNIPLVVAFSFGGKATDFLSKSVDKWNATAVWKGVGSWTGSKTLGRLAYSAGQSDTVSKIASKYPVSGSLATGGLSKLSSAGFGGGKKGGYEERLKAKAKAEEALHKRIGAVERGDYATEAEFKAAKERAKGYQSEYRSNLPWKGKVGGVIGFLVDNRANRQTAAKLNKKASDEEIRGSEKVNKKKIEKLKKERGSLDEKSPLILSGRLGEEVERNKQTRKDEIDRHIEELQEKIDEAQDIKDEERDQKIMGKLDELEKKESSGGGSEKPKKT